MRVCDLAGRPRGTGFVADHQGTVITSHEAVDGLARLVLHAPGDRSCVVTSDAVTPLPETDLALVRTEGLGLDTAYVESTEGILPATRFAVEAYVHFCRDRTPLEAIASSLTELFAPNLHEERISGMLKHYDFVNPDIMSYFSRRLTQAPRDAGFALEYVKQHAKTPAERESVCNALIFKTNVLWVQLDALYHAYVDGHIPPGAFVPKG